MSEPKQTTTIERLDWLGDQLLRADMAHLASEVETIRAQLTAERTKSAQLEKALSFFVSVIQSGEQWTPTCQEVYDKAFRQ